VARQAPEELKEAMADDTSEPFLKALPAEKFAEIDAMTSAMEKNQESVAEPFLTQDDILAYLDRMTPDQLAVIDAKIAALGPGAVEEAVSATSTTDAQQQWVPTVDSIDQGASTDQGSSTADLAGQEHPADSFEFDYSQFTEDYQFDPALFETMPPAPEATEAHEEDDALAALVFNVWVQDL